MAKPELKDDGGPAFPRTGGLLKGPNAHEWVPPQSGMSLRDWFAGHAMQAQLAHYGNDAGTWGGLAENAYEIADAMLASRGAKHDAQ